MRKYEDVKWFNKYGNEMIRTAQVKDFNRIIKPICRMYVMTTGTGAMFEPERVKGWVAYASHSLGDKRDFAKWFSNQQELNNWLEEQE